jgi:transposase
VGLRLVHRATRRRFSAGDIVIMDNLPAHKITGIQESIEAVDAELLYLLPYSPELNPIKQVCAKLKDCLRTTAKRTVSALWETIGDSLSAFMPSECANYLIHSGYFA